MTSATVRGTALPLGEHIYALTFELRNETAESVDLASYEPFTDFEVLASAGGVRVPVHQPELDIAVREVNIRLPRGVATLLQTPVCLRIEEGAQVASNGLLWTVPRDPDAVSLQVRLLLPPPFDLTCPLVLG